MMEKGTKHKQQGRGTTTEEADGRRHRTESSDPLIKVVSVGISDERSRKELR